MENKDYLNELRLLIKQYPFHIEFYTLDSIENMTKDMLMVYDLLKYCAYKTTKEDIKELIEKDIEEFEKVNILKIRELFMQSNGDFHFGKHRIWKNINILLKEHFNLISDRLQLFTLVVPLKEKKGYNLRNMQGLPSAIAEEFENEEIEKGKKIGEGKKFIVQEGEVIPID